MLEVVPSFSRNKIFQPSRKCYCFYLDIF